ncbi:MAG: DNA alkylation repair protein [Woeseiaceae bacterium]|nr:DNA alkylation repair protein [Woeseiaceae bacterium]
MKSVLRALGSAEIAEHSAGFFKSGKGEYGEGDRFLGIRVPMIRKQVTGFRDAPLRSVLALLRSQFHEERLLAVLLLVEKYRRGDAGTKQRVFDSYLSHRSFVNNWDLVDSSAHLIVGPQLQEDGDRRLLCELAGSESLWDRRIAMMATFHYIRNKDFTDALQIAELLLNDEHDLIHKSVGWMLREIGKRDRAVEERFLERHYHSMPRTMLRYAIEKFPAARRKAYLHGKI